jgi:hypothetical protein
MCGLCTWSPFLRTTRVMRVEPGNMVQSWIGGLCALRQLNKPNYPHFISPKSAPYLTLIKLPVPAWR